jgi:hypothetical protein
MVGKASERDWPKAMPEVDRLIAEEDAQSGGAASDPVGEGGAAVTAAERRRAG